MDDEQIKINRYQYIGMYTKSWEDFAQIKGSITEIFDKSNNELSKGYVALSIAILAALIGWFGFKYPENKSIGLLPIVAMALFFTSVLSSLIFRDLSNIFYLKGIKVVENIIQSQTEVWREFDGKVVSNLSSEDFKTSIHEINTKYLTKSNTILEQWNNSWWSNACQIASYVAAYSFVYGLFVLVHYISKEYFDLSQYYSIIWYLLPLIYFVCVLVLSRRYLRTE